MNKYPLSSNPDLSAALLYYVRIHRESSELFKAVVEILETKELQEKEEKITPAL